MFEDSGQSLLTLAERIVREGDAWVAEASQKFDVDRLEEELLRRG